MSVCSPSLKYTWRTHPAIRTLHQSHQVEGALPLPRCSISKLNPYASSNATQNRFNSSQGSRTSNHLKQHSRWLNPDTFSKSSFTRLSACPKPTSSWRPSKRLTLFWLSYLRWHPSIHRTNPIVTWRQSTLWLMYIFVGPKRVRNCRITRTQRKTTLDW